MNTIKKILIPIDFSNSANAAINYALGMTQNDRNIEFTLIHVLEGDSNESKVKVQLDEIEKNTFASENIKCNSIIKEGTLADVLIKTKDELDIDLIVMGTAGSPDIPPASKTISLLKKADCSLLAVPEKNNGFELKNIALAWDKKAIDDTSNLGVLHDLARWYNAKVHLLTIDRDEEPHEITFGENVKTLEYYMESLDYRHSFPKNTDIEQGINDYVKEKSIDILAIMPRHHAVNTAPSNGKLTQVLAGHSDVPLLILD
ncbi:MAG: universal stress protein [Reichenbachiella sp.]